MWTGTRSSGAPAVVLLVALAAVIAPGPVASGEDEAAIRAVDAQFVERFAAGDSAGLASLYTEDAQLLPPNADIVSGRSAIAAFWQAAMEAGVKGAALETVEVLGLGEMACEVGRYRLANAEGDILDQGKYIVIWKKTASGWQLHRDIWNSSVAIAVPAAETSSNDDA